MSTIVYFVRTVVHPPLSLIFHVWHHIAYQLDAFYISSTFHI